MSSFLLGGRAWVVDHVVHADREVHVRSAPAGKKPTWGGFMPRFLGSEVCERIRGLLEGEELPGYLDEKAKVALGELRADLGPLLRAAGPAVQVDAEGYAVWWTYAGGRINHTLKYALEVSQGWKVGAENFFVKISGDGVNHTSIEAAVRELSAPGFWSGERMRAMRGRIPPYRLSKFQDALPDAALAEMLGGVFIDAAGAQAAARRAVLDTPHPGGSK
jgi:ATP-dependent Lhr-like helicase